MLWPDFDLKSIFRCNSIYLRTCHSFYWEEYRDPVHTTLLQNGCELGEHFLWTISPVLLVSFIIVKTFLLHTPPHFLPVGHYEINIKISLNSLLEFRELLRTVIFSKCFMRMSGPGWLTGDWQSRSNLTPRGFSKVCPWWPCEIPGYGISRSGVSVLAITVWLCWRLETGDRMFQTGRPPLSSLHWAALPSPQPRLVLAITLPHHHTPLSSPE